MSKNNPKRLSPWLVWGLATAFFAYEFLLRVAPSAMVESLMKAFAVGASGIGFINAVYFYVFSPMQIPIGVLMDRYGARRSLFLSMISLLFGCCLFALAEGIFLASLGRFFLGLGSAAGFVAVVYISSHWFPKDQVAFLVGIANSIGMLGAVFAQGPTSLLKEQIGFRWTFVVFFAIGFCIFLLISKYLKDDPDDTHASEMDKEKRLIDHLKAILKSPYTWLNGIACFLFYSLTSSFAGLWGISFLSNVHGIDNEVASFGISLIFIGWIIGGPIVGKLSDYFQTEKPFVIIGPLGAFLSFLPIIYLSNLNHGVLYLLLLIVGIFSSAQILHYTISIELNDPASKGTAVAFTNFITMMGTALMQPFFGYLLELFWTGTFDGQVPTYSVSAWRFAASIFPLSLLLALLINLCIPRKTHTDAPEVSF